MIVMVMIFEAIMKMNVVLSMGVMLSLSIMIVVVVMGMMLEVIVEKFMVSYLRVMLALSRMIIVVVVMTRITLSILMLSIGVVLSLSPDASVVHASCSGQLQASPHMAGLWLSPGKPTQRAVTTIGSSDLVVGEGHMLEPNCQWYSWQAGRCGSIAFGSSPRRGKTLYFKPPLPCRSIHLWKRLQEITSRKNQEWSP